jgi:hypothetical protein
MCVYPVPPLRRAIIRDTFPVLPTTACNGGGGNCTHDLRVMGPTSCYCSTPRCQFPARDSNPHSRVQGPASFPLDEPGNRSLHARSVWLVPSGRWGRWGYSQRNRPCPPIPGPLPYVAAMCSVGLEPTIFAMSRRRVSRYTKSTGEWEGSHMEACTSSWSYRDGHHRHAS